MSCLVRHLYNFTLHLSVLVFVISSFVVCVNAQSATPQPLVDTSQRFCGASWEDAAGKCAKKCPAGMDFQCETGEKCYDDVVACVPERLQADPQPSPAKTEKQQDIPVQKTKSNAEKKSGGSELWEWLGPTIGAISTVIGALIAVFCVRKQKENKTKRGVADEEVRNDTQYEDA